MVKGHHTTLCAVACAAVSLAVMAQSACAENAGITPRMDVFSTTLNGRPLTIERSGAVCPPACVQPMQAASGVVTIGELEVLDFIDLLVSDAKGLLLDARLPEGFGSGTVPGAVNVPASTLRPQNPYRDDLLSALGVEGDDFSAAFDLVIFGAAADDPEAPGALRDLLAAGYPAAKLKYYRGGVQAWQGMGLSLAASE